MEFSAYSNKTQSLACLSIDPTGNEEILNISSHSKLTQFFIGRTYEHNRQAIWTFAFQSNSASYGAGK